MTTSKIALVSLGLLGVAAFAEASVIDPAQSDVPDCLVACPAGDVSNEFVMRDFARNPRPGAILTPDFCDCQDFHLVLGGSPTYVVNPSGCEITDYTDQQGAVDFPVQGSGACADFEIYIGGWAWGGPYPRRPIASVDLNGDRVVDSADLDLVESKLGTTDRSADFDCDGVVTSSDVAAVNAHLHHVRPAPPAEVPARGPGSELHISRPPSPNPSPDRVTFSVANPRDQDVEVSIMDLSGRRLATLWSGRLGSGESTFRWDGFDRSGAPARPGLYAVRLRSGSSDRARLFTLLR